MIWLFKQRRSFWLGLAVAVALSALTSQGAVLQAAQWADGTRRFDQAPRLVDFTSLRNRTNDRRPVYYLTVNLSPNAGAPLKTLKVSLTRGRFRRLNYRLDQIDVFQGDRKNRGPSLAIAATDYDDQQQTLTVTLAEPATPGQIITFALRPASNPSQGGVYLFEVTAAPEGGLAHPQLVGIARLNIFDEVDF